MNNNLTGIITPSTKLLLTLSMDAGARNVILFALAKNISDILR
ncbi:hypothetical protein NUBL10699_51330 [Klebsiella pneumoniae]|nr:hypothetical protein NUBL10699_51330 [Klebsiella pneumoniae]